MFNDAGGGRKRCRGFTSLADLEREGIAAAAVSHNSARIGDALDAWENGVVCRVNALATEGGVLPGRSLREELQRFTPRGEDSTVSLRADGQLAPSSEFAGQVALVTGGARGIGRACCLRLSAGGAAIALNYRSDDAAARGPGRLIQENGGTCELFRADVGDEPAFRAAADEARARIRPDIQLLVANAGTTKAISP